ncbi:MAG: reductive dehalogenase [Deltaproteobacteria bacterium]|nr:reductive dehalogenase [Deltaproteobacteria bacterium]
MKKDLQTKIRIRKVENPPYKVVEKIERFNPRNNLFQRKFWDPMVIKMSKESNRKIIEKLMKDEGGFSIKDFALWSGAWYVSHINNGEVSNDGGKGDSIGLYDWSGWDNELREKLQSIQWQGEKKYPFTITEENREKITQQMKEAAVYYGASRAGICKLNRDWLFSHNYDYKKDKSEILDIDERIKTAVVMIFEMSSENISKSPAIQASIESGFGYSRMAFTSSSLAQCIRMLGYTAIPAGNDTALSIPLAIDAGLGQLGRNGLLVTPEYGARVRIAKVLTDMPLKPDKPIDFGLTEFCDTCRQCALNCRADAISFDNMSSQGPSLSNNGGVMKWYLHPKKCYQFWSENALDCSTCISSCPFSK